MQGLRVQCGVWGFSEVQVKVGKGRKESRSRCSKEVTKGLKKNLIASKGFFKGD